VGIWTRHCVSGIGLVRPTPAFSGESKTVLAVAYKDMEGCETRVRTDKREGCGLERRAGFQSASKKCRMRRFSLSTLLISHCQMINERHPRLWSFRRTALSRCTLHSSFGFQYRKCDLGGLQQFLCMCQKQPCTKIAFALERKTKSGLPGRSRTCRRKR